MSSAAAALGELSEPVRIRAYLGLGLVGDMFLKEGVHVDERGVSVEGR